MQNIIKSDQVILADAIFGKIKSGQPLNENDATFLYTWQDASSLRVIGEWADEINETKNGKIVFYNINRHINPTNICALSCKFCAFSKKPGDEGAYEYSMEEMIGKAKDAVAAGAKEVHMVGGLHPRWKFEKYCDIIATLRTEFPSLHIKAFTAVEMDWMAKRTRKPVNYVIEKLVESGLSSMPGGGAEIFHPEIRDRICDTKVDAARWLEIHEIAHGLGLWSNATMLYGHIENYNHRVHHLNLLRELQDKTGHFNAFIPLSFQPYDNDLGKKDFTLGTDDLRTMAISRLFLHNFKNIKAYWIMLGKEIAQLSLNYGANDLDGTVTEEKISNMAGSTAGMSMSIEEIEKIIRSSGKIAVERDSLYNIVKGPSSKPAPKNIDLTEIKTYSPRSIENLPDIINRLGISELHEVTGSNALDASPAICYIPVIHWSDRANVTEQLSRALTEIKNNKIRFFEELALSCRLRVNIEDELSLSDLEKIKEINDIFWAGIDQLGSTLADKNYPGWKNTGLELSFQSNLDLQKFMTFVKNANLDVVQAYGIKQIHLLDRSGEEDSDWQYFFRSRDCKTAETIWLETDDGFKPNWPNFFDQLERARRSHVKALGARQFNLSIENCNSCYPVDILKSLAMMHYYFANDVEINIFNSSMHALTHDPVMNPQTKMRVNFKYFPALFSYGLTSLSFEQIPPQHTNP